MKLAVSNIAWTEDEEKDVAKLLQGLHVKYVEVALTKKWQDPVAEATPQALAEYKEFWAGFGIEIVALQSMLFNRPDLKIFEDDKLRAETLDYLQKFIPLAAQVGARVMVFGSPKNRQRGELSVDEADAIAKEFFGEIAKTASQNNVEFCIEPNPRDYACDFVTTAEEGIALVKAVNNPGFGLHLDIAGMTLAGDDVPASITAAGALLKHFHISAPFLEQVDERNGFNYRAAAKALKDDGYEGFVSIEMKPGAEGSNVERVKKAVEFSQKIFA